MILVVLGTHELSFDRLLKEIDKQIEVGNINEEVVVQAGHTKYKSKNMTIFDFTTYERMGDLYKKANYIITHGGTGSITMGMKMGKKVIAVPRLIKYSEHNDDHQLEIVKQFKETGHILYWNEPMDLADVIRRVEIFQPARFESGNKKILSLIKDFIDGV
ncbi:PssE/Cps14G family polysaccharide biosynthesis glycosyltransferase [Neobacillus sp. OS1-2]|uniref:PssE/Cps14G family polysaccharide biosynthesis glycosyltransferase n=1 Tax=Neobacillus sp. OS1-2 TaxID=3070680 RepID=UPI0027E16F78|nr:PssE/Cps14G family polysaccharide biosynthesis glycosyltransferase [Neobacillus sp. OS1-2]WML41213.1 PssE/Cps14G family polysaccharide biosynthesis glycosyltransferase [Neobacillus sp. OS1-2]